MTELVDYISQTPQLIDTKHLDQLGLLPFYYTEQHRRTDKETFFDGDDNEWLFTGGYHYLGTGSDARIHQAIMDAIKNYLPTSNASEILGGGYNLNTKVQSLLCDLYNVESATLFKSGSLANKAFFKLILGKLAKKSAIVIDYYAHNSIVLGARTSGAVCKPFKHNDMVDLERVLQQARVAAKEGLLIVAVDGLYSMDGDIAKLKEIKQLCKQYQAYLFVDDAHGFASLGEKGLGVIETTEVKPDFLMVTFSKSLGCPGLAAILSDHDLQSLSNFGCSERIFTGAIPALSLAAGAQALRLLNSDEGKQKLAQLRENTALFLSRVNNNLKQIQPDATLEKTNTPIIPCVWRSEEDLAKVARMLYKHKYHLANVLTPAVPVDQPRFRFGISANHCPQKLIQFADHIAEAMVDTGARLQEFKE